MNNDINVVSNPTSSAKQLMYSLEHINNQFKENAKYEDNVMDYNKKPLKSQLKKQAQMAIVPLPKEPKVLENFVIERDNIIAITVILFLLLLLYLC